MIVLRKDDSECVKKCTDYVLGLENMELEGSSGGRCEEFEVK